MNLARQGYFERAVEERRPYANWMAMLLSGMTGEVTTAAFLMGEDEQEDHTIDARTRAAERDLKKLERRMRKGGLRVG